MSMVSTIVAGIALGIGIAVTYDQIKDEKQIDTLQKAVMQLQQKQIAPVHDTTYIVIDTNKSQIK